MLRPGKTSNNGSGGLPAYGGGGQSNGNGYSQQSYGGYGGYGGGGTSYSGYGNTGSSFGAASGGNSSYDSYGSAGSGTAQQQSRSTLGGYGTSKSSSSKSRSPFATTGGSDSGGFIKLLKNPLIWMTILCLFLSIMTLHYRGRSNGLLSQLSAKSIKDASKKIDRLTRDVKRWERDSQSVGERTRTYKDQIRKLESDKKKLEKDLSKLEKSGGGSGEDQARLLAREQAWINQVYLLQNSTQREARREVEERFGAGPHHVKFTIKIPKESASEKEEGESDYNMKDFVAELAPLSLMPHAVHLFLEQVHHKLWDGTFFYLNGPHVMQAGPQDFSEDEDDETSEGGEKKEKKNKFLQLQKFIQYNLDKLSFPEYSPDWPHEPWTMGFTGRPGGPDWYINKVNNSVGHGPGGQFQHPLEEQADPCFAKIVEGKDVLKELFALEVYPADNDWAYFLYEPIEIQSAVLMEEPPPSYNFTANRLPEKQKRKKKKKRKRRNNVNKEHVFVEP